MRVAGVVLLAGCGFHAVRAAPDVDIDAPLAIDAPPDGGTPVPFCYGSQPLDMTCLATKPTGRVQMSGPIDTDSPSMCEAATVGSVAVCVLAGDTFEIADHATLSATGSRPLVIVATTSITLMGASSVLDVGGHGHTSGAAALPVGTTCASGAVAPTRGGGGWGGSSHGHGSDGGNEFDSAGIKLGSGATAPAPLSPPSVLSGGCPGGFTIASTASGGGGGGVIVLIAPLVRVEGTVTASGGGGRGGAHRAGDGGGGGGGGAGGLIVIDAATIAGGGHVVAQGGGGGEAGDATDSLDGRAGADGFATTNPGAGGNGGTSQGGAGGSGAIGTSLDGGSATGGGFNAGGGGGGGAAGFNFVFAGTPPGGLQFAPAPTGG